MGLIFTLGACPGFLTPSASPTTAERDLESCVAERLAAHKRPRVWRFVEGFPLTPSDKIQKYALRDDYLAGTVPYWSAPR